ncbi:dTDP-3-amino-3,6-dideoxy-alpha-D-glucopyranose N,N-dimethyltransferase/dTDP-3-amino-3,4,6-trideoxy-alpha-D-glucopyranose N,N-dimethyltransferase/N-methyltransferase [Amycolatopsis marina]|uniref:dTDP-3-amino-3,6-dideoxy-alpha-D-glucopyranose N,N-dimethyltransferase/dTDP-3-amino-3,4,6-trideoxy-alpha-D-glucopyranose N,N-dimethyltransferase/N-methyltransferase n=1 Tax=Amycolatopsis marina TaxID=490629 RepID=A0A1I1BC23_9PSEU|nr:class I SAM-dependent methyltransferase [Amycolatopsis marina]SFB47821.1 dTDP-3-amino-3,6-dideoxy-alpha-D-glucopyranose N,N-dimethyltransferase/dTDP-3-amino-3,4,6-trideoxy-alpha-D-glucopyranose N,N-dimethyltransferase/N-methyltransferase [Amycolatopsis marina]
MSVDQGYARELAEIYDAIYLGRGKDYRAEVRVVLDLARDRLDRTPNSLLDVACGTGAHLRHFTAEVSHVEGLELSPDMRQIAAERLPETTVHGGDMREFVLHDRFDVLTCMFSSIGYLRDQRELDATLRCFAAHLTGGGVVVVEPWYFPESFLSGYVSSDVVRAGEQTIARMSHSVLDGTATLMRIHYVVGHPEQGIRHFTGEHRITLFDRSQYERAFVAAGLTVEYVPGGPSGRGLFVGTAA